MILEDVITQIGLKLEQARQQRTAEQAAVLEQLLKGIEKIAKFINDEFERINNGPSLDDKAKSTARRKALEQAGRKFEALKARKLDPTPVTEHKQKAATVSAKQEHAILQYLREKEIRDRLYQMTEAQILSCFGDSLFRDDNPLLLDALLNAPPGFELLSTEVLAKLRAVQRARRKSEPADGPGTMPSRPVSIADTLDLVRQELDRLRRKELPLAVQEKTGKNR